MNNQLNGKHIELLHKTKLFNRLTSHALESIIPDFKLRIYSRGATIFNQGDEGRSLYVVFDGLVRVFHLNEEGNKTTVNFFEDGEIFGEFAAIDDEPRSATAMAATHVVLLEMRGEHITYHLQQTPGMALAMCRQLVYKARITSQYAEMVAQRDAKTGLLGEIIRYTLKFGKELEADRRYELDLGLTQEELGTLIGKGRTTINPILRDAEKRGLLLFTRGKITIFDLPRLIGEVDTGLSNPRE